jgi:hypothetical protein
LTEGVLIFYVTLGQSFLLLRSDQEAVADNGARLPPARRSISRSVIYDGCRRASLARAALLVVSHRDRTGTASLARDRGLLRDLHHVLSG